MISGPVLGSTTKIDAGHSDFRYFSRSVALEIPPHEAELIDRRRPISYRTPVSKMDTPVYWNRCSDMMRIHMITLRLPPEVERRIEDLVSRAGYTKTFYVTEAVLEYLDDMEEKYLALNRLEHPAKRWTLDELEQGLDMER